MGGGAGAAGLAAGGRSEQGCPAGALIQEGVHTVGGQDALGPAEQGLGIRR